jgi:hypothetical protein
MKRYGSIEAMEDRCIFQDPCLSDLIFRINISVAFKNRSQYLKVGEVVYPNFLNFCKCSERLVITRTDVSLTDLESSFKGLPKLAIFKTMG